MPISKHDNPLLRLSPFVAAQVKKTADLLSQHSAVLDLQSDWQNFQKNNTHLDAFALMRNYRQSRLAIIANNDLQNNTHLQTLKLTSQLAQLLISHAFQISQQEFIEKYGELKNGNNETATFIIFALGKLGGYELNYSSDVDLTFCYSGLSSDFALSNGPKQLSGQSYFNRMGRRIIQLLDSTTVDGLVYRVDMRLRPFGSAAPLVCSVEHLLQYLHYEGRDWERYAWLRARFVAGDEISAKNTLKEIEPFVYRKYLDYSIFESLRQIKQQIERKQSQDQDNLKLGYGGIREIEFIVQTLQITFAGRNKQLRGADLWSKMQQLCDFGHLSVNNLQQLTTAWLFLRKVENLCQIIHDRDTHHLPNDVSHIAKLMDCKDEYQFLERLNKHRKNVHNIFDALFLSNKSDEKQTTKHSKVQQLKDQVTERKLPKSIKHKLYAALDAIVPFLGHLKDQELCLSRYQSVLDAVCRRSSYLSMLIESPPILQKLVKLITYSAYFSTALAKTPALLELLFEDSDPRDFKIEEQWKIFSKKHKPTDDEAQLETLIQFKLRFQFKTINAYVTKTHSGLQTCWLLSDLAEFILARVIQFAWYQSQQNLSSNIQTDDLIVIAYGSLAMRNMHLNSDFDLVFIMNQEITSDNHKFIMRWIKRIFHLLTVHSYSGKLYTLDTQLRPNGKSGAAIVSQNNFENYQIKEAWLWEHAALIKSRVVYANNSNKHWYQQLRKKILIQKRNPQKVDEELKEMAKKMQLQSNKNHQQEFEVLGNILKQAYKDPSKIDSLYSTAIFDTDKLEASILNSN